MTEARTSESFERRLTELVTVYTEAAGERAIDPLGVSRAAMAAVPTRRPSPAQPIPDVLGRWLAGPRAALALVAILLVGVVAIAIQGRRAEPVVTQPSASTAAPSIPEPSASSGESILEVLGHPWQRPTPVAPGPDQWGSGFLTLNDGLLAFGREPGSGASRTSVTPGSADTFVVTATGDTRGCQIGDAATYEWRLEGQGTVLTLTTDRDACAARESLLAGPWVRADLTGNPIGGTALAPGTHQTSAFDPLRDPGRPAQLVYTVPAGWDVVGDDASAFVLHQAADASAGRPTADLMIAVWPDPALLADLPDGVACDVGAGPLGDAPGVGRTRDDLVAAITARPGVVSSKPRRVTFGDLVGEELDLQLAPTWTRGCSAPEGRFVTLPFLHMSGSAGGPIVALAANAPVRLILVDVATDRTLAIVMFRAGPSEPATFQELFGAATPVVDSFAFEPRAP